MQPDERGLEAVLLQRLDELGGRVACACERCGELGVDGLDAGRRRDAVGVLAGDVEPVLKPLEGVVDVLVVEAGRIGREALQLRERPGEPGPERADLRRVPLPDPPRRCHRRMLLVRGRYDRPPWASRRPCSWWKTTRASGCSPG